MCTLVAQGVVTLMELRAHALMMTHDDQLVVEPFVHALTHVQQGDN